MEEAAKEDTNSDSSKHNDQVGGRVSESGKKGLGLAREEDSTEMNRTEWVTRAENRDIVWDPTNGAVQLGKEVKQRTETRSH